MQEVISLLFGTPTTFQVFFADVSNIQQEPQHDMSLSKQLLIIQQQLIQFHAWLQPFV